MTTRIYGADTALPDHTIDRRQSDRFMRRVIRERTSGIDREEALMYFESIHENSGIEHRHSVLEDFTKTDPDTFEFFPDNWRLEPFPSTRRRMEVYESESIRLAEEAARASLQDANVSPGDVTHLIFVSCTGMFAPGPDILLVDRLGMNPDIRRTVIGFMGCYGAFNGLRTADQIVSSDPDAVVLQINVELCSLHYQVETNPETLVSNALFGDGAAATVLADSNRFDDGLCDITATHSRVTDDSLDQMQWNIGDTGFSMGLDPEVPSTLEAGGADFVNTLLDRARCHQQEIGAWLIHPGGPRIIDAVRNAVGLDDTDAELARSVLRDFGNMSSPTVLFALRRQLDQNPNVGPMAMLGFGPGLTMEGAVLTTV